MYMYASGVRDDELRDFRERLRFRVIGRQGPGCEFRGGRCVQRPLFQDLERNVLGCKASTYLHRSLITPPPTISQQQTWLIAIGLIAVDLLFPVIPIIPFLAAYVLLARPDWFKDFIDDVYSRS